MTGTYRMAGQVVRVRCLHPELDALCADYRWEGEPDFEVAVDQADIEAERLKSAREDAAAGRPVQDFSDDYLEQLAVYRRICERMIERDTFLFHSSAVAVDGECFLFAGKSGTGKSTHARLWRQLMGDRAVMVNDDKPLIRVEPGRAVVCGTPWDGKHRLSTNMEAPLKAICVLRQAPRNRIRPLTREEAYPLLLQQTYRPADAAAMARTLKLLDDMMSSAGLYLLECNMELSAAMLSYNTMKD